MRTFASLLLLLLGTCQAAWADGETSGWSLSLTCPSAGSSGSGSFAASRGGDFSASGTRTCSRSSTRFTRLYFSSYTGLQPHAQWNTGGSAHAVYAVHTGDLLIVPPILETEHQPIFTVNTACPTDDVTVNWIFVQWDTVELNNLEAFYVLGTSEIAETTGASTITAQYDVDGSLVFLGSHALPSNACSSGIMTNTGLDEEDATTYFTSDGAGVYKSSTGRATFFLPQQETTLTDLGSLTYQGIQFDSLAANGVSDTRQVRVTSNAAGTVYTIEPYSNVLTGTIDTAFTDTITISSVNNPQDGMLLGTVTRTGAGAGGPTNIACITHAQATKGRRVICSGQSPSDPNVPYNITFLETVTTFCPENYVFVDTNTEVGADTPFCVSKYEMKIQGDDNGNQPYNSSFVAESRPSGTAWIVSQDQASNECQALGPGFSALDNAGWQAIAREIEVAQDGGNYLNWSNQSIAGNEAINVGAGGGAASSDDDPCFGTGAPNCENYAHADFAKKRTHTLATGGVIWDFGIGGEWVWAYVDDTQFIDHTPIAQIDWIDVVGAGQEEGYRARWSPSGTYTAKASSPYGGLGSINASSLFTGEATPTAIRGYDGIFSADLFNYPLEDDPDLYTSRFRCVLFP